MNSLSARILISLIAGMALGILFGELSSTVWMIVVGWIEPIGTIWINAIRMVVIPLVVSAIIVGVASAPDLRSVGNLGGRAILLFLVILFAAALFAILVAPPSFALLDIDPAAASSLRQNAAAQLGTVAERADHVQSIQEWVVNLVPVNPVKAAADGAMLPLIVFSVAFGLAISRITPELRDTLVRLSRAVLDASLLLVQWILRAAPIGVFALSLGIAARLGTSAAGAVLFYVVLVCILMVVWIIFLTLVTRIAAGWSIRDFLRFAGPAQAVGFSSRSSLVALPAMVAASERAGLPLPVRSFFLPLAVATFRCGSAIVLPAGTVFLAKLYGVDLSTAQLLTVAVTSVFTTFSTPGIPGGSIIVMLPVLLSVNLPAEGIGLLLAVDTLPDMFRTATNVTGDMTVATILSRGGPRDAVVDA